MNCADSSQFYLWSPHRFISPSRRLQPSPQFLRESLRVLFHVPPHNILHYRLPVGETGILEWESRNASPCKNRQNWHMTWQFLSYITHWSCLCSGCHSWFVFGRSQVRFLARRLAASVVSWFLSASWENVGITNSAAFSGDQPCQYGMWI
jgi:hypothetical protein